MNGTADPAPSSTPRAWHTRKWHVANGSDLCPTCRGIGTHLDGCVLSLVAVTHAEESIAPSGFTYPASTVIESDALSAYIYDDGLIEANGARVSRSEFRAWLDACIAQMDGQGAALIVGAVERPRWARRAHD